jgi:hypothetical protein
MPGSTRASSVISSRRSSAPSNKAGKQGRIADRGAEAQQSRASGLNLVIAAIVLWNSTYIADAIAHLRATEQSVPDAWLAHTSPLSWEHISFRRDDTVSRLRFSPMNEHREVRPAEPFRSHPRSRRPPE